MKIKNPILALIAGLGAAIFLIFFAVFILALIYIIIISIITGVSKGEWGSLILLSVPVFPISMLYMIWTDRRKFPKNLMVEELKY